MSDDSPAHSGADSPTSSSGFEARSRKSPDSLSGFESNHLANFSAAHQQAMAQAAMAAVAGLAGPGGSGKRATVNNNLVRFLDHR
jgi:hypothetical protein